LPVEAVVEPCELPLEPVDVVALEPFDAPSLEPPVVPVPVEPAPEWPPLVDEMSWPELVVVDLGGGLWVSLFPPQPARTPTRMIVAPRMDIPHSLQRGAWEAPCQSAVPEA